MKTILVLCAAILLGGGVMMWRSMKLPEVVGSFTSAPKTNVADLIERPKDFQNRTVSIEGQISQQCKAMGCFFFFAVGEKQLRVDLEPIAMSAPMREGRMAKVEGQMMPYGDGYQFVASAVEFK